MLLHTQTGQNQTDERQLRELLKKADLECEQRMKGRGTTALKTTAKAHYNDSMQTSIQNRVNEALRRRPAQGGNRPAANLSAVHTGRARRIQDIDDETLIRSITDPIMVDLDEGYQRPARTLDRIDDETFIRSITEPAAMDLR